jgi:hypothetical protein
MILSNGVAFNNQIQLFDVDFSFRVTDNNKIGVEGGEEYDRQDQSYIIQQTCTRRHIKKT